MSDEIQVNVGSTHVASVSKVLDAIGVSIKETHPTPGAIGYTTITIARTTEEL